MTVMQDLTKANSAIGSTLVRGAARIASTAFLNLGSWRDEDVERYIQQIAPGLMGAKLQAAKSTVAFYKSMAQLTNQDWTEPVITASDLETKALRKGVGTSLVYSRPFVDMRTALSQGKTVKESIEAGARRAAYLASTEVQLARRQAGLQARNSNDRIVGYIRTLTGMENCALCYVASTQRYRRGELMPIHPGCDCGEMPIFGTQDPGQVINEVRLEAIHENVEQRFGVSDRSARAIDYRAIKITEHGEMGPMLTVRGDKFTDPADLSVTKGLTRIAKPYTPNELEAVRTYGGGAYIYINRFLRDGDPFPEPVRQELDKDGFNVIDELDSALNSSFIAEDATLLRGIYFRENNPILKGLQALKPGDVIEDAAYLSTTKATEIPSAFIGNVEMRILAKAGVRGIDANEAVGGMKHAIEDEVILPRGTKLKVVAIELEPAGGGRLYTKMDLEVIDDGV